MHEGPLARIRLAAPRHYHRLNARGAEAEKGTVEYGKGITKHITMAKNKFFTRWALHALTKAGHTPTPSTVNAEKSRLMRLPEAAYFPVIAGNAERLFRHAKNYAEAQEFKEAYEEARKSGSARSTTFRYQRETINWLRTPRRLGGH